MTQYGNSPSPRPGSTSNQHGRTNAAIVAGEMVMMSAWPSTTTNSGADKHSKLPALPRRLGAVVGVAVCVSIVFAIPNGGHRHPAVAAKMRQEGVKAGVPDIALMTPRNGRHGLFLELKNGKRGRVRESQREYLEYLNQQGYLAIVCHSLEEAQGAIEAYLRGMLT